MMSEINPRHSIKARRKQKEETVGDLPNVDTTARGSEDMMNHNIHKAADHHQNSSSSSHNNNTTSNELDGVWRSKYEAAVRKRRSPIAVSTNTNNHNNITGNSAWGNGRNTNLSPMSNKSSAVNSITSMSQADMEFILATSMDTYDQSNDVNNSNIMEPHLVDDSCSPTSHYSADSIIRRVEAEIAAARKSAAMAKHNQYYNNNNNNNNDQQQPNNSRSNRNGEDDDDDDDDMAHILNTTNTFSDHHPTMDHTGATSPSIASSADSSKRRAMDLIHDEFRSTATPEPYVSPTNEVLVIESKTNATGTTESPIVHATAAANNRLWHDAGEGTSNSFLMNLRHTTKEMVKQEETMFHPFEEKKEDSSSIPKLVTDFGTPTRMNGRRSMKDPDASNDGGNTTTITMDPDGEYQETTTPPRPPPNYNGPHGDNTTTASSSKLFPPLSPTLPQQNQQRSSPMDKTRELLDSLKEQRQSLQNAPSPSHGKNVAASSMSSAHGHGDTVELIGANRSNNALPPSPSARNQRHVFPEEVYQLVKETQAVDATGTASMDQSRRIRFRNPFPLLKPPTVHRSLDEMIHEHAMALPDIPVRWVKPKQELKQLIVAAMGTSLPRRSNACGALKVLTRHEKNQVSLVRTDGFLHAITYAASQSVLDVDTDLAIDARTRAVTCFKNVCHPKDNRIIILNHPGVIECLLKVVQNDDGAGRATAAAAIALLAKTPQCRECLVHIEGLIDTLAKVMRSAGTLISEEAMAVRSSSPRSGSQSIQHQVNSAISNAKDENTLPVDSSIHQNGDVDGKLTTMHNETNDSTVTESSSLSSGEGDGDEVSPNESSSSPTKATKAGGGDVITMGSKLFDVRSVDSIRNQTEERYEEYVNQARCNACAALLHISKQCATSVRIRIVCVGL